MLPVMRTPRSVEIDITNRCNLRCLYCSHFTSAGDVASDLSTGEWLTFFDELGRCAVMDVILAGGEPFMREDLPELIDGIVRNNMRYSILSNGTLLTEDHARFLARTRRCDNIQVSIDGSTSEIHESCRGPGSYQKAVHAIKILKEYKVPVSVRVTIHHRNVRDLPNIARFLLEDLDLPSFSTNSASYLGLCQNNTDAVSLTIEDRMYAMRTLLALNETYNGRIAAQAGPGAESLMWQKMMRDARDNRAAQGGEGRLSSCGGVFSKLGVRADGVYIPCGLLPGVELGRINEQSLEEIWVHHPELHRLRKRGEISLNEFDQCGGCIYILYCRGGCPALSFTNTGSPYNPSPDACLKKFLHDGGIVPQ